MAKIDTLLPASGAGFVTFNRGTGGVNQFGQWSTIGALLRLANVWFSKGNHPLSIGHISKKFGGAFPPHKSHRTGLDVDIRPVRTDGENAAIAYTQQAYSQARSMDLLETIWRNAPVKLILFSDPVMVKAGLSKPFAGHDNHFHIRLRAKNECIKRGDRGSDVAAAQAALGIANDGRFGPNTEKAVKEFQAAHNLTADGEICAPTWKALEL